MTERVRQWWGDLRPGLKKALEYQHEARASGFARFPPMNQRNQRNQRTSPSSRLGDVFGRLTASARGLTERVQSATAPTFRRVHDQAEHTAQAIVGRFETDPIRQQAPFLGPGRVAVFFRSGVSVGQAQRLLSSNEARPLRIIPRNGMVSSPMCSPARKNRSATVCASIPMYVMSSSCQLTPMATPPMRVRDNRSPMLFTHRRRAWSGRSVPWGRR